MTEQVFDDSDNTVLVSSQQTLPFDEKILSRKTIVYETLVDPAVVKIAAENLKNQLFAKYGFLRPAANEINVTSIEKFYQPYLIINGKYSIDYYRKRIWNIPVENNVAEIVFPFTRLEANTSTDASGKAVRAVTLQGEERVKKEIEASLVLNEAGIDTSLKDLPSAPSEKNPEETLTKTNTKQVPPDLELSILRTRIFKRPTDVSWIANETFQVSERLVIYAPRFRATFKHTKTGKERVAEFDGVTGKLLQTSDSRITNSAI